MCKVFYPDILLTLSYRFNNKLYNSCFSHLPWFDSQFSDRTVGLLGGVSLSYSRPTGNGVG